MYFFRCYNHNSHYRENRPSACKTAEVVPKPDFMDLFKTVSAGGVTLTSFAGTEKEYDYMLLYLECPPHKRTDLTLNFSCNLSIIRSVVDIQFQLVKTRGGRTVPLAAPVIYRHILEFTGSDAISFSVCDPDPEEKYSCTYFIRMHMTGTVPANGMVAVTNTVLTAICL